MTDPTTIATVHSSLLAARTQTDNAIDAINIASAAPPAEAIKHRASEEMLRRLGAFDDMLAALKYADAQLRGYGQIDPKVRAAIAKAEGRT